MAMPGSSAAIMKAVRISALPGKAKRLSTYASWVPMMVVRKHTATSTMMELRNATPMFDSSNAST